eukprot:CAMPEP_0118873886 /NCGR_PEP_ID=MMETSP1163-20130328/15522_1 /TAXON_ID=124430 /ORGANISM="Phaeomonas parva, Strain CCMP2877" /LENGTH=92 /DNA_ID=CAMNT_0006809205 /DNA_START=50 /DNA_END=325 /DNA_ORIENTATION=+
MTQIPLSFNPDVIEERRCHVEVRGTQGPLHLTWIYPIRGVAEAPQSGKGFKFVARAKESSRGEIELPLLGLANLDGEEPFRVSVEFPEDDGG